MGVLSRRRADDSRRFVDMRCEGHYPCTRIPSAPSLVPPRDFSRSLVARVSRKKQLPDQLPNARSILIVGVASSLATACSVNRYAINKLGDALSGSNTTFASDDDPDLVGQAVPFSLKLIESLLASSPNHQGLLLAAASGFTEYSYAFVQPQADSIGDTDVAQATLLRARARRLNLRARDYGLRGLEVRHKHFTEQLRTDARAAVRVATAGDVSLLYWTAASWGSAIVLSKDIPELVADQLLVEALIDRALELNEGFDGGAIHTFLVSYEFARQGAAGDPVARARAHFQRAVSLSNGRDAAPFVAYAEAVSLGTQDRAEFESVLGKALAIDPDANPERRLANLVMQRRARWLLSRAPDLFLDKLPDGQLAQHSHH
jgi:predicted anti-sigma-YlaC factor YlaD